MTTSFYAYHTNENELRIYSYADNMNETRQKQLL